MNLDITKTKICPYCKIDKLVSEFGPNKKRKDGLRYECNLCRKENYYKNHEKIKEQKRLDYAKHKESRLLKDKIRYQENKEEITKASREFYNNNKESIATKSKEYREKNKEVIAARKAEYWRKKQEAKKLLELNIITVNYPPEYKVCNICNTLKLIEENFNLCKGQRFNGNFIPRTFCKECESIKNKQYRIKNGDKLRQKDRDFRKNNPELAREIKRKKNNSEATRIRLKSPKNRILRNMHQYIKTALEEHGLKKNLKSKMLYLGCTREEFYNHIEKQFLPGMTWENYGTGENNWSIDHYIPKEAFNILNQEEQDICFHYTNLQPLWHIDNEIKQDKMPDGRLARDTKQEYGLYDKIRLINDKNANLV